MAFGLRTKSSRFNLSRSGGIVMFDGIFSGFLTKKPAESSNDVRFEIDDYSQDAAETLRQAGESVWNPSSTNISANIDTIVKW